MEVEPDADDEEPQPATAGRRPEADAPERLEGPAAGHQRGQVELEAPVVIVVLVLVGGHRSSLS